MAHDSVPVRVGDVVGPRQVTVPLAQLVRWAGASGDFSPIHFDRDYATGPAGLPDLLVHGPLKMALVVGHLVEWAGGDPTAVRRISLRYGAMDVVDSTLEITATVTAVDESAGTVELVVSIANGGKESTSGTATVRIGPGAR